MFNLTLVMRDKQMYLKIGSYYIKMTKRQQYIISEILLNEFGEDEE